MILQKYEDETFGYKGYDNKEFEHGKVILEQKENESRDDFIAKNNIQFESGEYGSDESKDISIVKAFEKEDEYTLAGIAKEKYGLEKLKNFSS